MSKLLSTMRSRISAGLFAVESCCLADLALRRPHDKDLLWDTVTDLIEGLEVGTVMRFCLLTDPFDFLTGLCTDKVVILRCVEDPPLVISL